MKKEELIPPIYDKQPNEKTNRFKEFTDFLLYPTNNIKEFAKYKEETYEKELKKYNENKNYYENTKFIRSTYVHKLQIKKPVKPKKPPKYNTYNQWAYQDLWLYRKDYFNQDMDQDIIGICRTIIRNKLENLFDKQVKLYKKALDKLYDDIKENRINWSQFNNGVQGLHKLYDLILIFQDRSTEKKDLNIKSETETTLQLPQQKTKEEMDKEYEALIQQYLQG